MKQIQNMATQNKELKRLRMSFNLTQKQLAESINVSPARYSSWERGEKNPSATHLQALASKLKCSISKLVAQPEESEQETDYCNDKLQSFSYFVHEREEEKEHFAYLEDFIIKLSLFDLPLKLNLSKDSRSKSLNSIIDGDSDFIWIETVDDKLIHINRSCIEWTILHDDAADEYPSLSGNKFHETPLIKGSVDKDSVLFMMAKNGNFEISEDINYYLSQDLEWLINKKSRLVNEIPQSILSAKTVLKDNYTSYLNETEKTNYDQDFANAWGVRVYLKSGKQIFLPGMSCRGDGWDEAIQKIRQMSLYDENPVTVFSDHENSNTYCIPTKDIMLVEYPNVFEGMGLYAEYEDVEEINDFEEVDSIIKKFYDLAWDDSVENKPLTNKS